MVTFSSYTFVRSQTDASTPLDWPFLPLLPPCNDVIFDSNGRHQRSASDAAYVVALCWKKVQRRSCRQASERSTAFVSGKAHTTNLLLGSKFHGSLTAWATFASLFASYETNTHDHPQHISRNRCHLEQLCVLLSSLSLLAATWDIKRNRANYQNKPLVNESIIVAYE